MEFSYLTINKYLTNGDMQSILLVFVVVVCFEFWSEIPIDCQFNSCGLNVIFIVV